MKAVLSIPHTTQLERLLLRREIGEFVRNALADSQSVFSWQAVAQAVRAVVPAEHSAPTAGELAAINAMQLASASLVAAYMKEDPQRFAPVPSPLPGRAPLSAEAVRQRWLAPLEDSAVEILFLAHAQSRNPSYARLGFTFGADHLDAANPFCG